MQRIDFLAQAVDSQPFNHRSSLHEVPSGPFPPADSETAMGGVWLVPLWLVAIAWTIIIIKHSLRWKGVRNRVGRGDRCQTMPCLSCQFYSNNPYLPCAVHPSRALKAEAIDCSDYSSKQGDRSPG